MEKGGIMQKGGACRGERTRRGGGGSVTRMGMQKGSGRSLRGGRAGQCTGVAGPCRPPPPPRSPPQPPASPGPGRGVLTGRASAPSSSAVRCPVPTAAARALPPGSAPEGEGEAAGAERSGAAALRTRPPAPAIDFLKQLQLWHFLTSKHTHTHTDAHTHTHSARSRALHRHPEPLSGVCGQHRHQHPNPSCILHQVQDPAPALCTQHLCNPALHAPYSDILHPEPSTSTQHCAPRCRHPVPAQGTGTACTSIPNPLPFPSTQHCAPQTSMQH